MVAEEFAQSKLGKKSLISLSVVSLISLSALIFGDLGLYQLKWSFTSAISFVLVMSTVIAGMLFLLRYPIIPKILGPIFVVVGFLLMIFTPGAGGLWGLYIVIIFGPYVILMIRDYFWE